MVSMNSNEISAWIRERIAKDLGSEASAIDPEVTFDRIGLDSLALLGVLGDLAKLLAASRQARHRRGVNSSEPSQDEDSVSET